MDRHEYEINQLINPKKDIVKSNSKHRDKIETLILGRHVERNDSGTEPPQKTLWKKSIDSLGSYIYCEVIGNDTLILPKKNDLSSPIVQNGIIVSFTTYPDMAINSLLVGPLNEKGYNIPSSGWMEKTITENRGDSVPDWNEYQLL